MKCPACYSEIDDRSYRCNKCHRICSYRRLCWRYRYVLFIIFAWGAFWAGRVVVRRVLTADYGRLPEGALVSDSVTRAWLGLTDKGWFCEEPHHKGELLHLRHKVFQPKDVIIFIHGFIGDYVNTWGKPSVLLDDPRFNPNYDFAFYGFKTALFGDVPAFDDEAAKLDRTLSRLEENYNSITIVTHSKGGLLAMRTLLNRAKDFPTRQPYKIHKIVMFTPLTENVSLAQSPGLVKLIGAQSKDVAQMQANTYSELGRVKEDLKALLEPQDSVGEARKEHFLKDVAEHLYVINAERDGVVDVGPNGEKIVSEAMRKLSELPSLGAPHLVTLRYKDIGGAEEDAREAKSAASAIRHTRMASSSRWDCKRISRSSIISRSCSTIGLARRRAMLRATSNRSGKAPTSA
jgi:pimeloyl-ACP methyl ester carboxylesterase